MIIRITLLIGQGGGPEEFLIGNRAQRCIDRFEDDEGAALVNSLAVEGKSDDGGVVGMSEVAEELAAVGGNVVGNGARFFLSAFMNAINVHNTDKVSSIVSPGEDSENGWRSNISRAIERTRSNACWSKGVAVPSAFIPVAGPKSSCGRQVGCSHILRQATRGSIARVRRPSQ